MRAQNLATLMSVIDPVQSVANLGSATTESKLTLLTSSPLNELGAVVLAPPRAGKVMLAVQSQNGASQVIEAELPPDLARLAARNPGLFREGAELTLKLDPETHVFRLVLPEAAQAHPKASLPAQPATIRAINPNVQNTAGTTDESAPPLANPFPVGSIGAAIAKLTGLAFPLAERASDGTHLPTSGATPASGSHPRPATPAHVMLPPELGEAALRASVRQTSLGSALSQLLANTEITGTDMEDVLKTLRLDGTAKPTPETIKQAIQQSGLFMEAHLARGDAPPADLKSALLALKSSITHENNLRGNTLLDLPLDSSAPPFEFARMVEGAVERLKLLQMASLPDHPEMVITDDRAQGMRLAMSIPLATRGPDHPQTAMMGLMIEHHTPADDATPDDIDPETGEKSEFFPWKVRIAVDLEETGPVQAEIALRGQSVAVTLWAERKSLAAEARAHIGALHSALREAAFDVTRLDVRDGRPTGKPVRAAHMLDRCT